MLLFSNDDQYRIISYLHFIIIIIIIKYAH